MNDVATNSVSATSATSTVENGVHAAHLRLRNAVIAGDLREGSIVSQSKLAELCGVSRTPLREALRLLEREGWVIGEPNRRVRIAPVTIDDLEQVYAMRITLEVLGARVTIPVFTDLERRELDDVHEQMRAHAKAGDYDAWAEPHRRFHRLLIGRAGPRILQLTDNLTHHAERYRRATTVDTPHGWAHSEVEHAALRDAAFAGDTTAVCHTLGRHYARVAITAAGLIAPEHEPRLVRQALRSILGEPTP